MRVMILNQGRGLVEQSTGLVDLGVGLYLWWELGKVCFVRWAGRMSGM